VKRYFQEQNQMTNSQFPDRPHFRNRLEEREWEARQADVPQNIPQNIPGMPTFLVQSDYRVSMSQSVLQGQIILTADSEQRSKLISEWRNDVPLDEKILAASRRFADEYAGRGLPPGLKVVG
jgi:hypothetical protein